MHTPVLDGVYVRNSITGQLQFQKLPPPSEDDLERVLCRVRRRALGFLARNGHDFEDPSGQSESNEEPGAMEVMQAASIRGWVGATDQPRPVETVGRDEVLAGMPFPVQ